nr:arsenite oxidase, AOI [Alcaligenes faecalis, Peptide Partial, 18 aa] [Alcaligenes faecalis]
GCPNDRITLPPANAQRTN